MGHHPIETHTTSLSHSPDLQRTRNTQPYKQSALNNNTEVWPQKWSTPWWVRNTCANILSPIHCHTNRRNGCGGARRPKHYVGPTDDAHGICVRNEMKCVPQSTMNRWAKMCYNSVDMLVYDGPVTAAATPLLWNINTVNLMMVWLKHEKQIAKPHTLALAPNTPAWPNPIMLWQIQGCIFNEFVDLPRSTAF